jgi:hypothetical protein
MGYRAAAASYYRQSMQLSGTSISCQYLSRQCGGVSLPRAAAARLAAVERVANPPRARRIGASQSGPEAPETAPLEAVPAEMAGKTGVPARPGTEPPTRPAGWVPTSIEAAAGRAETGRSSQILDRRPRAG